jgi:hypothetical protein
MRCFTRSALTVFLLLSVACGSDDPPSGQEACRQTSRIICDRIFDCTEGQSYRAANGGTKDGCIQLYDEGCLDSPTGCGPGQNYNPDRGQACVSAIRSVTCADVGASGDLNTTFNPSVCNETCTDPAR